MKSSPNTVHNSGYLSFIVDGLSFLINFAEKPIRSFMNPPRTKYPVGIQTFSRIIEENYLYVDKTEILYDLVSDYKYVFLNRPRRFGKSLMMSTLEAYFKGRRELFDGLAMGSLEKDWKEYPVLRIDLSAENYNSLDRARGKLSYILSQWEEIYGGNPEGSLSVRFTSVIANAFRKTGRQIVVLIDEYDKPLLDSLDDSDLNSSLREEFRGFYSVLKAGDEFIRFVMMTGITRFTKVSVFSGLNNLEDISLSPRFNSICGITETEMHRYFQDSVARLAESRGKSESETWKDMKERYDGYHFAESGEDIYNPLSVLKTFKDGKISNYWYATGTPGHLVRLLMKNNFRLGSLDSPRRDADELAEMENLRHDVVPLLYQSGYLTIKGYDPADERYILGFPNGEVAGSFWKSLYNYFFIGVNDESWVDLKQFAKDIFEGDPDSFMNRFKSLLSSCSSESEPDKEIHFQNMMAVIGKMLGFEVQTEVHTSQGRSDMVLKTPDFIYIFEFKINSSPEEALNQIFEKGYSRQFESDPRKKFLIGVDFSTKTRTISDWIVAVR